MAISSNQGGGLFADINITPLTDIFLVLLIIFMVATAITIESAAHVDLPKVQAQSSSEKPKGVLVMYTSDHRIFVNQTEIPEAMLPTALKDAITKDPDKLVVFQGDPAVILADAVHILDVAKTAGAQQIALAVAKLPGPAAGAPVPSGPIAPPEPAAEGPGT
ncbi:MAG TPA: biopolymer transporter ExbD [Candidatus Binataceae bacterium]|jgi:biopolymer transport protein ExbD|nr:biopolymer transporter ExbD [Candidatus Binataceae bacterium]